MRFLICDLKRLFSKRAMIALFILAPAAIMVLFSSIVVPMIFTGRGIHFRLAIFQEDQSIEVQSFVYYITHGKAISDLSEIITVDTLDEGLALLENQEVSVVVHIPPDIVGGLQRHETVTLTIISTEAHAMEQSLITMTLGQALLIVGQSQNQLAGAEQIILSKGISGEDVAQYVQDVTIEAIEEYMGRRSILGKSGAVSPMGEFLPVEYYLAAVFAMFAALAMLPLIHFTAGDLAGSIFHRGLASGRGCLQFYLARLGSGSLFILLVLLMVIPTSLLLGATDILVGDNYSGNLPALLATIVLAAFCLSALGAALAVWISKPQPALWAGFYLALGMAITGGALVPDGALPPLVSEIGRLLPLRAIMRCLASALFDFEPDLYAADMLKLCLMAVVFFMAALWGFRRKERGR